MGWYPLKEEFQSIAPKVTGVSWLKSNLPFSIAAREVCSTDECQTQKRAEFTMKYRYIMSFYNAGRSEWHHAQVFVKRKAFSICSNRIDLISRWESHQKKLNFNFYNSWPHSVSCVTGGWYRLVAGRQFVCENATGSSRSSLTKFKTDDKSIFQHQKTDTCNLAGQRFVVLAIHTSLCIHATVPYQGARWTSRIKEKS
jgi:hypothetical protein